MSEPELLIREKLSLWRRVRFTLKRLAGCSPAWALTSGEIQRISCRRKKADFASDRAGEVADFFGVSTPEVRDHPAVRDKDALHALFRDVSSDASLFEDYRSAQMAYVARLMLRYNRFEKALALARAAALLQGGSGKGRGGTLIDYGCGVADFALAFFILGWEVVLVDIRGGNLDFARYRFETRGWPVQAIGVTELEPYPELPASDLIVAGEVLEHVRDPLETCRYLGESLQSGGLLWVSGFPFVEKRLEGDHLPEALAGAGATRQWLETHLQECAVAGVRHFSGRLFRKHD